MNNKKMYIVINENSAEYTGIPFKSFFNALKKPLENILIIKSEYVGEKNYKGFEIIEGSNSIKQFSQDNYFRYGDFCFVDYSSNAEIHLKDQDIAELLFASHTFRLLGNLAFEGLKNRFLYLAHDDGFYCKLFFQNVNDVVDILIWSISNIFQEKCPFSLPPIPTNINVQIQLMAKDGLYIDCTNFGTSKEDLRIDLHAIGYIADMDDIHNRSHKALYSKELIYKNQKWNFC